MRKQAKKILVILWMASCAGRRHLAGVCRYIAQGRNWDFQFFRRGGHDLTCEALDGVDGIISSTGDFQERMLREVLSRRIPLVGIDWAVPIRQNDRVSNVVSDDRQIGNAMAHHILSFGNFRSFGFVFETDARWEAERRDGFTKALQARHKTVKLFKRHPNPSPAGSADDLTSWLRSLEKPAVVMTTYDDLAVDVIAAARQAQIRVPYDLAVVGTDDDEVLCDYTDPPLTSIRPGHEVCGYAAAEELDRLMRGKPARTRRIPFEAITDRKSLAACIPATHILRAANDFINRHACDGIGVDDVARTLGVSRRLLSLRYAEYEGKSVHAALVDRRLQEVQRLLKKSDATITEITDRCGFPNANYLKRLFKQRTGKTMREWRRRGEA